ncbi:MAG: hypothetical protein ACOYJP_05590 [Oscillospiraceae bacterium]
MDIVDYINEVDRSNREQEAAYRAALSKRDFRIRCVFYARPLFYAAACFIYTTSRGLQRKYTLLWVIKKRSVSYMQKAPARSETRAGALFC